MLNPEQVVHDRYMVVRTLGRGGLSVVYEVRDLTLPQSWALKAFSPPRMGADELAQVRAAFHREVEILSRLSHPRLPRVVDAFHWQGGDYMVMERVEGDTLASRIAAATAPFDEATCRTWALQVLEVLEYLHGQSPPVIFRDIKPENLMIDPMAGIRFIDFGIARLFNPVKDQDTVFMGTPGFAAPEQFRRRQSDPRSDLYSLAATLHYLLTLRDPALNPFQFNPVSLVNGNVSSVFEQVLQRALEIKPENRFQTARDMARVLEGAISIDAVTRGTGLVVQPRELSFDDLSRRGNHVRAVDVHVVGGDAVECAVSSPHEGFVVEPARFEATQGRVEVRLRNERFPRGEMVQSALVFSIPQASVTVPVTVQFRPPLVQSLPAAVIGIVVFLWGALVALAGMGALQSVSPPQRLPIIAGLFAVAVLGLTWVAAIRWARPAALAAAALMGAVLAGPLRDVFSPTESALPASADVTFCISVCALLCNVVLMGFSTALSARQRQRTRPVLLAAFFSFPVFALLMAFNGVVEGPERANLITALSWSGLGLGFVFSTLLVGFERAEEARVLGNASPGRGGLLLGVLFWPLVVAAWMGAAGALPGDGSSGFDALIAAAGWLVRLPAALPFSPQGRVALLGTGALVLAACVVWGAVSTRRRRVLAAMVGLGFAVSAVLPMAAVLWGMSLSEEEAARALLAEIEKNPGRVIQASVIQSRFPCQVEYIRRLSRAVRMRLDGGDATAALRAAHKALEDVGPIPPALESQLRYLIRDAAIESGFPVNALPLPDAPPPLALLSPSKIQAYAGTSRMPRPEPFFVYYQAGGSLPLKTDLEVAGAITMQRIDAADIEGRVSEADGEAERLRELVAAAPSPRSDVVKALAKDLEARDRTARQTGDRRLQRGLALLRNDRMLALPFLHAVDFQGVSTEDRLALLALGAARPGFHDPPLISRLQIGVDPDLWRAASAVAHAYARNDYRGLVDAYRAGGSVLVDAPSPFVQRVARDVFLLGFDARSALQRDAQLRRGLERYGGAVRADDEFKAAWAHDMLFEPDAALPLYRSCLQKMPAGEAEGARGRLVAARVASGVVPSLVQVLQHSVRGGFTMTIVGQGVPSDLVPLILETYDSRDAPHVLQTSDNITLALDNEWSCRTSVRRFHKVRFTDVEGERKKGTWRFWVSYRFERFEGWPSALVRQDQPVFNSLFAVDFGSVAPPRSLLGFAAVQRDKRWFLVASRHRLDARLSVLANYLEIPNQPTLDFLPDDVFRWLVSGSQRTPLLRP